VGRRVHHADADGRAARRPANSGFRGSGQ